MQAQGKDNVPGSDGPRFGAGLLFPRSRPYDLKRLIILEAVLRKNSRRLWRPRRRKSRSVPEGGTDCPVAIGHWCPNLGRDSISRCRRMREEFSSSRHMCLKKPFQQGIWDSHSLLELSDFQNRPVNFLNFSQEGLKGRKNSININFLVQISRGRS